jgi:hypothetical protein
MYNGVVPPSAAAPDEPDEPEDPEDEPGVFGASSVLQASVPMVTHPLKTAQSTKTSRMRRGG